ncbi:hypothetical protein EDB89DRAFT_809978 [Lactarius sanguifluus]|nr:hypothetical protein EDB89DRAFT_809978 [Lactarius sanguifluus]
MLPRPRPRLCFLSISFQSQASRADRKHIPPETQAVLPTLTSFSFEGERVYLEDFVARIDAPQLDPIDITYSRPTFESPTFRVHQSLRSRAISVRACRNPGSEMTSFRLPREVYPEEFAIKIHISSCEAILDEGIWHMARTFPPIYRCGDSAYLGNSPWQMALLVHFEA